MDEVETLDLIQQKLATFELLQPEFEKSFQFVQDMHGLRRFPHFTVDEIVYYLHALWICDSKDRLLGLHRTTNRHEGITCLKLLHDWQEYQDTASVVSFLHHKLDMLPLAEITRQAQAALTRNDNKAPYQRLIYGRMILLNRGMNLMKILDTLFALEEDDLQQQVQAACEHYNHLPKDISQQQGEFTSALYSYIPHRMLAQINMQVMNTLGVGLSDYGNGYRSWDLVPANNQSPYAEQVVLGYREN